MKRICALAFALFTVTALLFGFTSCGGGDNPPPEEPSEPEAFEVEGIIYEPLAGYENWVSVVGPADRSLTEAVIPAEVNGNKVMGISTGAFRDCTSLRRVVIKARMNGIYKGAEVFSGCGALEYYEGVSGIGNNWFSGCASLTELKGDGETIAAFCPQYSMDAAINGFKNQIKKITFVNVDQRYSVYGMEALTEVAFEGACTVLPYFDGCSALERVDIPDGVTEINASFYNCSSLREITIPASVTSIVSRVAANCAISRVNVSDLDAYLNVAVTDVGSATAINGIYEDAYTMYVDGEKLTSLNLTAAENGISYLFQGCSSLRELTILDGVTEIGVNAFKNCGLLELTIPDSVTKVADGAFGGVNLAHLYIGTGLTEVGKDAFYNKVYEVYNLSSLDLTSVFAYSYALHTSSDEEQEIFLIEDCIFHKPADEPYGTLLVYRGTGGDVVLPYGIENIPKYSIATGAFGYVHTLISLTLPACVTSVDDAAFRGSSLECIYITGGDDTAVNHNAFRDANRLWDVYSTKNYGANGSYVWHSSFDEPRALTVDGEGFGFVRLDGTVYLVLYKGDKKSVTLPASYGGEKYGLRTGVFTGANAPETVVIPNGAVCEIQANSLLTSHCIWEEGCFYIGEWLYKFEKNNGLQIFVGDSLWVRAGTVGIANSALSGSGPFPVRLPDSLKYIGDGAFKYSSITLTIPSGVVSIGDNAFSDVNGTVTLPAVLPTVGEYAFYNTALIGAIGIDKNTVINGTPYYTFYNCGITEIVLRDGASLALGVCTAIKPRTIRISEGSTFVGDGMSGYYYNLYLENLYAESVSSWLAFAEGFAKNSPAYNDVTLYIDGAAVGSVTVPEGVEALPDNAFFGLSLSEITLPESLTEIGASALLASGLTSVRGGENVAVLGENAIASLDLAEAYIYGNITYRLGRPVSPVSTDITWAMPKAGTALPDRFFEGCEALSQVFVPIGCTLGEGVFFSVSPDFTVIFEDGYGSSGAWKRVERDGKTYTVGSYSDDITGTYGRILTYQAFADGFAYERADDNKAKILGYFGGSLTPVIPATLDGRTVTGIESLSFIKRTEITSVTFSEGIKTVGIRAFEGCTSLSSVILPESIVVINTLAFNGCTALSSVTAVGGGSFAAANALAEGEIVATVDGSDKSALAAFLVEYTVYSIGKL